MILSKTFKTVIIDDFHPVFIESLDRHEIDYHYLPGLTQEEALRAIANYEVVVVRSKIDFTRELIEKLPLLKCIARGGAGMDNIDEVAAIEKNIVLLNAPEGNRDAVAEHAIGMILSLSNNLNKANTEVRKKVWQREANRGFEIGGKTIGIIGFGNTGKALATKISGFGCRLISYDKYHPSIDAGVKAVDLAELQERSDIISLHVPLTFETEYMVNDEFLKKCKKDFMLVNTSRGKVVDQRTVLAAFNENRIGAYATDVLENEDFKSYSFQENETFNAMLGYDRIIMTPHVAGWSKESYVRIAEVLAAKLIEFTTK